jgi:hypothetical protein
MVANAGMLNKDEVIAYVGANANRYGLDPAALLAVANHEGLKTEPGSTWVVGDEPTFSFGPPSWYAGGAGADIVAMQGANARFWVWTPAGLDYWMEKASEAGASGLTGPTAIKQIIVGFERPLEKYVSGEIINATHDYPDFLQQLQTIPGNITPPSWPPITIPGMPQIPGQGQLPIPKDPQTKPSPQTTTSQPFSLSLFNTPLGPIDLTLPWNFSGILLFLAAIFAIIIGALLWKPARERIVTAVQVGAMAA